MKSVKIIVAIICIFIAIYNFDLYNFNRCVVSVLLLMNAAMILIPDQKIYNFLRKTSVFLAIFLILKILIYG